MADAIKLDSDQLTSEAEKLRAAAKDIISYIQSVRTLASRMDASQGTSDAIGKATNDNFEPTAEALLTTGDHVTDLLLSVADLTVDVAEDGEVQEANRVAIIEDTFYVAHTPASIFTAIDQLSGNSDSSTTSTGAVH